MRRRCSGLISEDLKCLKMLLSNFSKKSFDENMLKVHFIGEGAVDEGGPRREFFHLLIQEILSKSGFFDGFPERVILLYDVTGIANNTYYIIGKMISTCIIQGGEAPTCIVVSSKLLVEHFITLAS